MVPAYTSAVWLIGIGLIGQDFFFNIPGIQKVYLLLFLIFVFFHSYHSFIAFKRIEHGTVANNGSRGTSY